MYTIYESINELDELENIIKKVPFKRNRNLSSQNILSRNKSQTFSSKNQLSTKYSQTNIFYNFNNNFQPGNLLFEVFIHLSEFDINKFDFFVNYSNICTLLREINIIDKKLYTGIIISQKDIDVLFKTIKKNNDTKKLNFKEFMKFFSNLVYKIDFWHFIDNPKRTLKFNIDKFFKNYFNENKISFISLIYNYVLYVQKERNINEILKPIIPFIKNIFIKFYEKEIETNKENENITNFNDNINLPIYKSKFKNIINIMKYLGLFPFFINLKELVIVYYIELDKNNDNNYLNLNEKNSNFDILFKKFCQLFLCICLYIKEKKQSILKQYLYLYTDNTDFNFENELKFGQKEGIIRFILNLNNKNLCPGNNLEIFYINKNNKETISEEDIIKGLKKLKLKDINFLYQIFESYSSHFDKYLNFQISFSDIVTFLKQCNLIDNNSYKSKNLSIEKKYNKAIKKINKNISRLKISLHSFDNLFTEKYSSKNKNITKIEFKKNKNDISLKDIEIIFCKVSHRADINNRLFFGEFLKFLYLLMDKIGYNSINEFIEYLNSIKTNYLAVLMKQNEELNKINLFFNELKSNELIIIINQISPIINIYLAAFSNKNNIYSITYDIFLKIFTEFDIYPNVIGNNILKNIFYELYRMKNINNEKFEENKKIEFEDIYKAIGIIALYLKNSSKLDDKKILLGLFYKIAESKKINLELNFNFNFSDNLKNKIVEISKIYYGLDEIEEPEYKSFLENPFL